MEKFTVTALLVMALALPIALFLLLLSRFHLNVLVAAAVAVIAGWALNVAWALAAQRTAAAAPRINGDTISIAAYFGWACPAVLVLLAWLVWRFVTHRAA